MKNRAPLRVAEENLRHARRNIGRAWKLVEEMKILMVRSQVKRSTKPRS